MSTIILEDRNQNDKKRNNQQESIELSHRSNNSNYSASVDLLRNSGGGVLQNDQMQNNNSKKSPNDTTEPQKQLFDIESCDKCTSLTLGNEPINQPCYFCPFCFNKKEKDPQYLCKHCYTECHAKCRLAKKNQGIALEKLEEKANYKGIKEFACFCGNKKKHIPNEIEEEVINECNLYALDKALDIGKFFCESHKKKIQICCICSVYCHKNCKIILDKKNNKTIYRCQCKSETHSIYNEIALSFPMKEYLRLSGKQVWPIQILNILFRDKEIFARLKVLFIAILRNEELTVQKKKKFYPLLELFSNTFNSNFKTFYYEKDILNMLDYTKLIEFIQNVEIKTPDTILLKFRLVFCLLFLHLRKDFKTVKNLTCIDFISNTILERIEFRKILSKPRLFTKEIDEKYNLKKLATDDHILKDVVIKDVCHLMEIGMDFVSIEENQDEFEIGLKYICFMMKRMMFTKYDLLKLIDSIYIFFNKFYDYLNSEKSNIFSLLDIFSGLIEFFFMISINYNDISVLYYLDKNKDNTNINFLEAIHDFIQVTSEHGNKLFKMVLKSCDIIQKHYKNIIMKREGIHTEEQIKMRKKRKQQERILSMTTGVEIKLPSNGGLFSEKVIRLFTETLGIFCLADNIYFQQLKTITRQDLMEYYYFTKKCEKNLNTDFSNKEVNQLNEKIKQLQNEVEERFNELFTTSYNKETLKINSEILQAINNFSKDITILFEAYCERKNLSNKKTKQIKIVFEGESEKLDNSNNIDSQEYSYIKPKKLSDSKSENEIDEENYKTKKINLFLRKITKNNKKNYPFLEMEVFSSLCEEFVDDLIISQVDEIMTKILIFFTERKYPCLLSLELLEKIFSTLSLFFYSKRGMKYFLMGKNIIRINRIFGRFCVRTDNKNLEKNFDKQYNKTYDNNIQYMNKILSFKQDFIKGMNLYGIGLKNHKILIKYSNKMLKHIINFSTVSNQEKYKNNFIFQLKKTMKIFIYLSDDYEFEDFTYIKQKFIGLFMQSPIVQKNSFVSNFTIIQNIKKRKKENEPLRIDLNSNKNNNNNKKGIQEKKKDILNINMKNISPKKNNNRSVNNVKNDQNKPINPENEKFAKTIISLYFSFFKLESIKTYFIYKDSESKKFLDTLQSFLDLKIIKTHFIQNNLTIKQKLILLNFLRSIFFIDQLNEYSITHQDYYLTTLEYNSLIKNKKIVEPKIQDNLDFLKFTQLSEDELKKLEKKKSEINQLMILIEIYMSEIKQFPRQILYKDLDLSKQYYKELLFDLKLISSFFYFQNDIWSRVKIQFHQLCLMLLSRTEIFRNVFDAFKECKSHNKKEFFIDTVLYCVPLGFDYKQELLNNPPLMNDYLTYLKDSQREKEKLKGEQRDKIFALIEKMKNISFNIYNEKEVFCIISETIDDILKMSDMFKQNNLQKYLEYYDVIAEANFTPFSLLETLDYEYFYEEEEKENFGLIKQNPYLYRIKKITDSFLKTFIDVNNTNFLVVLTTISNDTLLIDYRQRFIDYFYYFLKVEGNYSHRLEILLCILTKMLFYNGEEMQDKFESLVNDKEFFPNFNKIMNIYIVLIFSLSRNIYAFEHTKKIGNIGKLIIQFLQSLGEGFNLTYHNNIFKKQEDILKDSDDEEEMIDSSVNEDDDKSLWPLDDKSTIDNVSEGGRDSIAKNLNSSRGSSEIKKDALELIYKLPDIELSRTIYESVVFNLKYALMTMRMDSLIDTGVPYDKLIIFVTNTIDFIVEYIASENDKNNIITDNLLSLLFGNAKKKKNKKETIDNYGCISLLKVRIIPPPNETKLYLLRKKILCYVKNKLIHLLIYYLLPGGKDKDCMISNLIDNKCSPIFLYTEILFNFSQMLDNLKLINSSLIEQLEEAKDDDEYVDKLISFYAFEEDFRNMIELPLILKLYILIKIFEKVYNLKAVSDHFEKLDDISQKNTTDKLNINSEFSKRVYKFLQIVIVQIQIRDEESEEETNEKKDNDESDSDEDGNPRHKENKEIAKSTQEKLNKGHLMSLVISRHNALHPQSQKSNNFNLFNNNEPNSKNENEEEKDKKTKTTFFPRPFITFCLSEVSKEKFIYSVNRSNAATKFSSLISFADYSLYEMILNRHLIGSSKFHKWLANINFYIVEIINYFFIIIQNILITKNFYKTSNLPPEIYDIFDESTKKKLYIDNFVILIIHSIYIVIVLGVWYKYKFLSSFQFNAMELYKRPFVAKRKGEDNKIPQKIVDYFQNSEDVSTHQFFKEVNRNMTIWRKLYIGIFETNLFNREINMLIFSLILNILFIIVRSYMFLVVHVVFVMNLVPTLFDIFSAATSKFKNITLTLLFQYLIIYIFSWIPFFFLNGFFNFEEILETTSGSEITESYCYSSLQCLLITLSIGTRSDGGIADAMSVVSYQNDLDIFFSRFFFDLCFWMLIKLVMGNVCLGIIIDAFGELRDKYSEKQNDQNNICFICQLSRDDCLTRNINFDKHVEKVHNIWDYVYFLNYLYVNNPNDFNKIENTVWEKLEEQDFGWLPIEKGSCN